MTDLAEAIRRYDEYRRNADEVGAADMVGAVMLREFIERADALRQAASALQERDPNYELSASEQREMVRRFVDDVATVEGWVCPSADHTKTLCGCDGLPRNRAEGLLVEFVAHEAWLRNGGGSFAPTRDVPVGAALQERDGRAEKADTRRRCDVHTFVAAEDCEASSCRARENALAGSNLESSPTLPEPDVSDSAHSRNVSDSQQQGSQPPKDGFDVQRVMAWMREPDRKPAHLAFTEGPERQAAYLVEMAASKPDALQKIDVDAVEDAYLKAEMRWKGDVPLSRHVALAICSTLGVGGGAPLSEPLSEREKDAIEWLRMFADDVASTSNYAYRADHAKKLHELANMLEARDSGEGK